MRKKININYDFEINMELLLKLLNVNEISPVAKKAFKVAELAKNKVKPKFIIKEFKLGEIGNDFIEINSQRFHSRVIPKQLKNAKTAFIFIATCGTEILEYASSVTNMFDNYLLDQIAYLGFLTAMDDIQDYLLNNFDIKKYISLGPGSIPDWNLKEVNKIFKLIGDDYKKIGVSVLESGMINPVKSVSGIIFETDDTFHSCIICKMANCPNRKAEFEEAKEIEMMK